MDSTFRPSVMMRYFSVRAACLASEEMFFQSWEEPDFAFRNTTQKTASGSSHHR